jgi:maleylpyruvate isomerase
MIRLYDFFRSGSSHRLRIALNLKGVAYEPAGVDLSRNQHLSKDFVRINPQHFVPVLEVDGHFMTQSPAIIEWLEECYPDPALLPSDMNARAHVRAMAAIVGCDIHPVNNKRILETLRQRMSCDETGVGMWCSTWIAAGFDAYESLLRSAAPGGKFSYGDTPMLADAYLVPQIESARRFGIDMTRWPLLDSINAACLELDPFIRAAPAMQPGAF